MKTKTIDLDNVSVSLAAMAVWRRTCAEAIVCLPSDLDDVTVPTERAEVLPGGGLRVFVPHPTRRSRVLAALVVPADHWNWRM